MPIILKLFLTFFQIGLFSFGGGYAALPLIQDIVVSQNGWITMSQMNDMVAISQMTPGPIGINSATFIGFQTAGLAGSTAATLGYVLPSIGMVTFLVYLMNRFKTLSLFEVILSWLRPAVIGLIAASGYSILQSSLQDQGIGSEIHYGLLIVLALSIYLMSRRKWNPIVVMLAGGGLCMVYGLIQPLLFAGGF